LAEIRAGIPEGSPLDTGTRHTLEGSFDVDLSAIRVHTGPRADYLARSVQADAFAAGPHLFFRADLYRPESDAGLWLLAHEVTHSIQQADGAHNVAARTCAAEVIATARPHGYWPGNGRAMAVRGGHQAPRHWSFSAMARGTSTTGDASVDLNDITRRLPRMLYSGQFIAFSTCGATTHIVIERINAQFAATRTVTLRRRRPVCYVRQ
jgi:hypothetical protein